MRGKPSHLNIVGNDQFVNSIPRRLPNSAYRTREHLTEAEVNKLLAALATNRHGARDQLIGLLIYRHGLRVSEACDLRWDDLDFAKRTIIIRRLKGSHDSTHYLERDELAGLKKLRKTTAGAYVFMTERGTPFVSEPPDPRNNARPR